MAEDGSPPKRIWDDEENTLKEVKALPRLGIS